MRISSNDVRDSHFRHHLRGICCSQEILQAGEKIMRSKKHLLLISSLLLSACGFETVDTGRRGVQIRFGEVDEKLGSLPEGLYFYNPFTSTIIELDIRVKRFEGQSNTYTRDVQQADIKFVVNYRLEAPKAHSIFKEVGYDWWERLGPQAVEGILKQIVGTYEAVDLIAHRQKATAEIQKAIADSLKAQYIIVERFEMVNIQYHKAYEKSVEDKVVAIQRAIEEQNRTKQVQEQAKQQVINAQAQAESMRIRANALQQNAKLVEYEAVQKWDGKLPQYVLGGAIPFISLPASK